ncbi:MAG: hypothetical protein JXX28_01070 [Deltaproteobacteria bacterium]|nr:hypothetical protein [Deltaproteobacteria bacterium]
MFTHLVAILSLALLTSAWVVFQAWIHQVDPGQPGVERHATGGESCSTEGNSSGGCANGSCATCSLASHGHHH